MKRILIASIVLAGGICAAADAPEFTGGSRNGRFWLRMAPGERIFFVTGFIEGFGAGGKDIGVGVTMGELQKGVDAFFEDPANAGIPISSAVLIFGLKLRGSSPAWLDEQIIGLRRAAAATKEHPPGN
jgi:hypothetical protein